MKKILAIMLALMMLCPMLIGCAELIDTKYETVQVEIVDEYYRGSRTTVTMVGKVPVARRIPARYEITVKYEGVEYTVSGQETYEQYKDMVGETVSATLEIRTYDDGTIKLDIISLGEEEKTE